jgi:hypothetical protein
MRLLAVGVGVYASFVLAVPSADIETAPPNSDLTEPPERNTAAPSDANAAQTKWPWILAAQGLWPNHKGKDGGKESRPRPRPFRGGGGE